MSFVLDKTLEADTFFLGKLPLCRVHLMNNGLYPWLILIPEQPDIKEIIDLKPSDQTILFQEIVSISHLMKDLVAPDKLNVAAIGNVSPQLHVHVVARFIDDACWPDPVWGRGKPKELYDVPSRDIMFEKLLPLLKKISLFKPAL